MILSELKTGEKGVIVRVNGHGSFRKRLIEMGFIQGKAVTVVLNAPLRDPIEYEIIGYKVSLRREEAKMIEVVSEEEAREALQSDEHLQALPGERGRRLLLRRRTRCTHLGLLEQISPQGNRMGVKVSAADRSSVRRHMESRCIQ